MQGQEGEEGVRGGVKTGSSNKQGIRIGSHSERFAKMQLMMLDMAFPLLIDG